MPLQSIATAQQLQVDSVAVDSIWNSDSSWYSNQGIQQQRHSRDLYLSFKPIGSGMAKCFVTITIDSGKVWQSSTTSDSLIVLDNGINSLVSCDTLAG